MLCSNGALPLLEQGCFLSLSQYPVLPVARMCSGCTDTSAVIPQEQESTQSYGRLREDDAQWGFTLLRQSFSREKKPTHKLFGVAGASTSFE